jgi:hypothetical protein
MSSSLQNAASFLSCLGVPPGLPADIQDDLFEPTHLLRGRGRRIAIHPLPAGGSSFLTALAGKNTIRGVIRQFRSRVIQRELLIRHDFGFSILPVSSRGN